MSRTTSRREAEDFQKSIEILERKGRQFEQRVFRANFPDALETFSRATGIEALLDYEIGYRASTQSATAQHYVHVYCKKSPPSDSSTVLGWRKSERDHSWVFTPSDASTAPSNISQADAAPIEVFLDPSEELELQVRVGSCFNTREGNFTLGLIIRDADDGKWGITVSHAFEFTRKNSGSELNKVSCCAPSNGTSECENCADDKCAFCSSSKMTVTIAEGTGSILFNPASTVKNVNEVLRWMDLAVFKIPKTVQVNRLVVRSVLKDRAVSKDYSDSLKNLSIQAYEELAGAEGGIKDVSNDIMSNGGAQVMLVWSPEGVFLFKKGQATNWTFAKLDRVTPTRIILKVIGKSTMGGDCGAIWWIINRVDRVAHPIGYHVARDGDTIYVVPYYSALEYLLKKYKTIFSGFKFQPLDSYEW